MLTLFCEENTYSPKYPGYVIKIQEQVFPLSFQKQYPANHILYNSLYSLYCLSNEAKHYKILLLK